MRKRLIAAVALTAIAGSAHAEDRRTQMFDDPNMNACWFGEASGCEAWAREDGYAAMSLMPDRQSRPLHASRTGFFYHTGCRLRTGPRRRRQSRREQKEPLLACADHRTRRRPCPRCQLRCRYRRPTSGHCGRCAGKYPMGRLPADAEGQRAIAPAESPLHPLITDILHQKFDPTIPMGYPVQKLGANRRL